MQAEDTAATAIARSKEAHRISNTRWMPGPRAFTATFVVVASASMLNETSEVAALNADPGPRLNGVPKGATA